MQIPAGSVVVHYDDEALLRERIREQILRAVIEMVTVLKELAMEKPNPVSDRDKDAKHPKVGDAELVSDAASRAANVSEQYSGKMERMVDSAMSTTGHVSSGMVGGVTNIATDLVHGIGTVGGEVVTVVRDTANSAIAGVGSIGETAVHTVTGLLADLVGGLRDIGSAATGGRVSSGAESEIRREGRAEEARKRQEELMH